MYLLKPVIVVINVVTSSPASVRRNLTSHSNFIALPWSVHPVNIVLPTFLTESLDRRREFGRGLIVPFDEINTESKEEVDIFTLLSLMEYFNNLPNSLNYRYIHFINLNTDHNYVPHTRFNRQ